MRRFTPFLMSLALLLTLALSACGSTDTQAVNNGTGTFTPQEVDQATGVYHVVPVYAVPKHLPKKYKLAFINPDLSVPSFQAWSQGMQAAAKFYGVTLIQTDVQHHFENEDSAFQTLAVQNPDVVGAHPGDAALLAAAQADGIPLITMDNQVPGALFFGIPDNGFGSLGGQALATAAQQKLQSDWKGRNLVFVGLDADPCDACNARVKAGLAAVRQSLSVSDANALDVNGYGPTDHPQATMTDVLTAHPNDVFIVLPINDEYGVGALQALQSANRLKDGLVVTLGCDAAGQQALRNADYNGSDIGCVDANPWAEGWNWVEAAIATALGHNYQAYNVHRVITSAQINQIYPQG
ncbi:MAG TPA: substrate-binding domain-containing protein [Ktedonobacterales bacterium]|nr:substrate-binding domain-containing protein [Ktedonobacterales bacterium]